MRRMLWIFLLSGRAGLGCGPELVGAMLCLVLASFNAEAQELGSAKAQEVGLQQVTAKELEVFGGDLLGTRVELNCTFNKVSQKWTTLLDMPNNSVVGIYVTDTKGELFHFAFADKQKFGRMLLKTDDKAGLVLRGKVRKYEKYGFLAYTLMVDEIEFK